MKRIISLAVICLSLVQLIAQNLPQGIAYQAVAVKDGPYSLAGQNPQAIYWSDKQIQVRFTIYEKYPGGSTQYSEFHATKTDDYGVFNLIIGQGNPISGDFTQIPWDLGTAHLQVEIDFDNNGTYKLTSLERFWSVPYAFVTRKSSSTLTDSALNALNSKFNYLKNRDKDTVIGNEGGVSYKSLDSLNKVLVAKLAALKASDKDTVIGNEWQKLTRNKDTLILSDGGGKVTLLDEDPKNELQLLTKVKDTVSLSQNGGKFILNDDDPKNELQQITIQNDSIFLSKGGGFVKLNKSSAGASTSNIPNGLFLDKSANLELTTIGPGIVNGPWTVNAIYNVKSNWQTTGNGADYLNEPHIKSNDSFLFFEPGFSSDCFTSYYFDTKQRYFAGPVDNVICASGLSKEKGNWDMKTLNSDNVGKCFFWFSTGTGLNLYYPSINKHYTSAAAIVSSTNLNWLATINTTNNKFFASYKKGNSIFISLNDNNGDILIYEYNFVTDQKKQLYNTKYNFTNNGLYQTRSSVNSPIDNSPRGNIMIDSFLVFPFDGKDRTGDLVNGKYIFGYFVFNYYTGKKDTVICNNNYPLLLSNAFENKHLFMCKNIKSTHPSQFELINILTKKTITLNFDFANQKVNNSNISNYYFYFYNRKMYLLPGPYPIFVSNIFTY